MTFFVLKELFYFLKSYDVQLNVFIGITDKNIRNMFFSGHLQPIFTFFLTVDTTQQKYVTKTEKLIFIHFICNQFFFK